MGRLGIEQRESTIGLTTLKHTMHMQLAQLCSREQYELGKSVRIADWAQIRIHQTKGDQKRLSGLA